MIGRGVNNCCQTSCSRLNDGLGHIALGGCVLDSEVGVAWYVSHCATSACRKQCARLERSSNFSGGCSGCCVKCCQRHADTSNCQYARSGRTAQGQHLGFALRHAGGNCHAVDCSSLGNCTTGRIAHGGDFVIRGVGGTYINTVDF